MDPNTQTRQLKMRLEEILKRLETHSGDIYIRANIEGKWQSHRLTDLPAEMAIDHVCRFIRQAIED